MLIVASFSPFPFPFHLFELRLPSDCRECVPRSEVPTVPFVTIVAVVRRWVYSPSDAFRQGQHSVVVKSFGQRPKAPNFPRWNSVEFGAARGGMPLGETRGDQPPLFVATDGCFGFVPNAHPLEWPRDRTPSESRSESAHRPPRAKDHSTKTPSCAVPRNRWALNESVSERHFC